MLEKRPVEGSGWATLSDPSKLHAFPTVTLWIREGYIYLSRLEKYISLFTIFNLIFTIYTDTEISFFTPLARAISKSGLRR